MGMITSDLMQNSNMHRVDFHAHASREVTLVVDPNKIMQYLYY